MAATLPVAVVARPEKNLRKEGRVCSVSRVDSIAHHGKEGMAPWHRDLEAAGPILSAVREQRQECSCSAAILLFDSVQDPRLQIIPPPFSVALLFLIKPSWKHSPSVVHGGINIIRLVIKLIITSGISVGKACVSEVRE